MRFRSLLLAIFMCIALATSVYAENQGTAVGEGSAPSSISESIGSSDGSSGTIVNNYNDMFSKMGDPSGNETSKNTSNTVAPIVSNILGFFIVIIPLFVLLYTALELACIFIKPLRAFCGAEGGNSSGGDMGGGKKVNFFQVSEDCIAVISGGGSGDMGGGGKKGVGDMAIEYLKLRMKTLIVCFVIIALFLTPFGSAIMLKIVQLIMNIISKIAGFI